MQIAAGSMLCDAPPLTDYALGTFKPKAVLERLLDPRPSYFAHKDILFAGLCAWTVASKYKFLVDEAMLLAGAVLLAAVEKRHQKAFPQAPMLADIATRVAGPGIDFYQDFYYPAGGLQRIIKARSPGLMQRSLQAASRTIGYAVEMMRVCHDHAERLQDRQRFRAASYISGGQAISDLIELSKLETKSVNPLLAKVLPNRTMNALNCHKKAAAYLESAAMIYAAYSLPCGDDSLLSLLCNGEATYKKHGHLLTEWVGRAAYVAQHVISPMYTRKSLVSQIEYPTAIEPIAIAPPNYSGDLLQINKYFAIAATKSATVRP